MTKQLLMSSAYWVLNKAIVKALGIETTFFLSSLVEAENIMADKDGWFYQTIDTVEEITGLSRYSQNKALKELMELGIVEQANRGIPMKRYFKINYENLNKLLCKSVTSNSVKNSHTRVNEINKLECEKLTTNKESIYKENNNKESNKELLQDSSGSQQTERTFDDSEFKEIAQLYQSCIGQPNGLTVDWIEGHLKDFGFEWLKNALLIAEEQGKRKKSYVNAILNNWKTEGGMKLGGNDHAANGNGWSGKSGQESSESFGKIDLSHLTKTDEGLEGWVDNSKDDPDIF